MSRFRGAGSQRGECLVEHDSHEPGTERAPRFERIDPPDRRDERVLHHILGIRGVLQQPVRDRERPLGVAPREKVERLAVATLDPRDELGVGFVDLSQIVPGSEGVPEGRGFVSTHAIQRARPECWHAAPQAQTDRGGV